MKKNKQKYLSGLMVASMLLGQVPTIVQGVELESMLESTTEITNTENIKESGSSHSYESREVKESVSEASKVSTQITKDSSAKTFNDKIEELPINKVISRAFSPVWNYENISAIGTNGRVVKGKKIKQKYLNKAIEVSYIGSDPTGDTKSYRNDGTLFDFWATTPVGGFLRDGEYVETLNAGVYDGDKPVRMIITAHISDDKPLRITSRPANGGIFQLMNGHNTTSSFTIDFKFFDQTTGEDISDYPLMFHRKDSNLLNVTSDLRVSSPFLENVVIRESDSSYWKATSGEFLDNYFTIRETGSWNNYPVTYIFSKATDASFTQIRYGDHVNQAILSLMGVGEIVGSSDDIVITGETVDNSTNILATATQAFSALDEANGEVYKDLVMNIDLSQYASTLSATNTKITTDAAYQGLLDSATKAYSVVDGKQTLTLTIPADKVKEFATANDGAEVPFYLETPLNVSATGLSGIYDSATGYLNIPLSASNNFEGTEVSTSTAKIKAHAPTGTAITGTSVVQDTSTDDLTATNLVKDLNGTFGASNVEVVGFKAPVTFTTVGETEVLVTVKDKVSGLTTDIPVKVTVNPKKVNVTVKFKDTNDKPITGDLGTPIDIGLQDITTKIKLHEIKAVNDRVAEAIEAYYNCTVDMAGYKPDADNVIWLKLEGKLVLVSAPSLNFGSINYDVNTQRKANPTLENGSKSTEANDSEASNQLKVVNTRADKVAWKITAKAENLTNGSSTLTNALKYKPSTGAEQDLTTGAEVINQTNGEGMVKTDTWQEMEVEVNETAIKGEYTGTIQWSLETTP